MLNGLAKKAERGDLWEQGEATQYKEILSDAKVTILFDYSISKLVKGSLFRDKRLGR